MTNRNQKSVNSSKIRVLVVDDHVLVAETVAAALTSTEDFDIDLAKDVASALDLIADTGKYQVVLLDYEVPGMDQFKGMLSLIEANDGAIALFSGMVSWINVESALAQGAVGFIPKTTPLKVLVHAIRLIADGEVYLPADYLRRASISGADDFGLKPREMRVLAYLCEGLQNKEIGMRIGVDDVIVKMDMRAICRKLGVSNRTQAVIKAQKENIV
jgi:two-component system, NarL family, nitrate/nitrite response regulator NarL